MDSGNKKQAPETVVPGDESPFKATVVSSAAGANIVKNLNILEKASKAILSSFILCRVPFLSRKVPYASLFSSIL